MPTESTGNKLINMILGAAVSVICSVLVLSYTAGKKEQANESGHQAIEQKVSAESKQTELALAAVREQLRLIGEKRETQIGGLDARTKRLETVYETLVEYNGRLSRMEGTINESKDVALRTEKRLDELQRDISTVMLRQRAPQGSSQNSTPLPQYLSPPTLKPSNPGSTNATQSAQSASSTSTPAAS